MTNPTAPDGRHHHTLTPVVAVDDVGAALDFYARAFGAQEIHRAAGPGNSLVFAQMRIGDSIFFVAAGAANDPNSYQSPSSLRGTSCAQYMYVADAEQAHGAAVAAGAKSLGAVASRPWGDREGLVRDPFGHLWAIADRRK